MEDRISDLPDDVLQQILHLLPLKYAVRTTVLSKRWKSLDVCSTCVDLNFIPDLYEDPWLMYKYKRNKNIRKKVRRFLYGINKVLRQPRGNNLNIQKFVVMIPQKYPKYHKYAHLRQSTLQREVNRWMSVVATPGLSVLDLRIFFHGDVYYSFPLSTLAAAKSLKTLSLSGFRICCSPSHGADISFPCLEKLSLELIMLDDFVMQTLLQVIPLLEDLRLVYFKGIRILKFEGLSRLKVIRIEDSMWNHGTVVIDAPCLRVLEMYVKADVITLATCPRFLQQLTLGLYGRDIEQMSFQFEGTQLPFQEWFCRFFDQCRFLEHLTLSLISNMKKIHISSTLHALKTLTLNLVSDLVSFEIVAPSLEKFYLVPETYLPFIRLNASEQLEFELNFDYFSPDCELNNQWYTRWVEFLSYFKHSRALIIEAYNDEICFVPKESRKDLPRSLFGVKSLELIMIMKWHRPFSDYVDYMLWLSPRATNLTFRSFTDTQVVVKCLYDENKVVQDNEDSCCKDCIDLLNVRCWRHSLKQVIIEEFNGYEREKQDIKSFFQRQVKNLNFVEQDF